MTAQKELLESAKSWVAASKAKLTEEGVDIAMTVSDSDASGGGKGASVTVYAQTQSPDLFDDSASTEGFVELTARATIWEQGEWYVEVLVAETADTIREERRHLDGDEDPPGLLDALCQFLKAKSYTSGRA
jgi:hypothetical protein